MNPTCPVCQNDSKLFDRALILNKYNIDYYRCLTCKIIFTQKPFWLQEAYQLAITASDTGLLRRNLQLAQITKNLIQWTLKNSTGPCLDYAGGYGLFTGLMRDLGFDFYWTDRYCKNIFSPHFTATDPFVDQRHYQLITAFELIEHLQDPLDFFNMILKNTDHFFFSTELVPSNCQNIKDWWYFAPHEGQHILFWTAQSLEFLAQKLGLTYYTNGRNLHFFSKTHYPHWKFKLSTSYKICKFMGLHF